MTQKPSDPVVKKPEPKGGSNILPNLGGLPGLPGVTRQKTQTQKRSESDGFGAIDDDFGLNDEDFDWDQKNTPSKAGDRSKISKFYSHF
jgi:hypothetical protein